MAGQWDEGIEVLKTPCCQVGLANPQIVQSFYHTSA